MVIYVLASVLVSSMCCVNVNYVFYPRLLEAQDEELIKREEKRIREFFEFLDDAEFLENMRCKRLNYPRKHEIHLQSDEEIAPDSDEE